MSYKSIVTFIHDPETQHNALVSAASVAKEKEAHLTVICLGIDQTNPGVYYAGANALVYQQTLEAAESEGRATEEAVRSELDNWQISWEVMAITSQVGSLAYVVSDRTQFSDLVILPKPYGAGRGVEDVAILEAALFRTRVPVLVLPDDLAGDVAPTKIVIAWNESVEALAAVRAAMPYLKAAEAVDIAIIDPPTHGPDRSDPGGALATMLARHGVKANVSVLAKTMPQISDVLDQHCQDWSAEMLVMGAYGHSRLREAILGGATRNTLEMAVIPVLMAH